MNGENSKSDDMSDEESNGREVDFIAIDEAGEMTPEMINSLLSDVDAVKMFEFTCTDRARDLRKDGWNYLVKPVNEYGDLDFKGHTVLINGTERVCHSFEVSEGSIIIFVAD